MTPARIVRRPDGEVCLSFPYTRSLIEGLKSSIPAAYRTYDPADHTWTVAGLYGPTAIRLVRSIFPDAEVIEAGGGNMAGDPWAVLHLRETAPPELIEAVYKVLARLHHPDQGGDHERMLALNQAHAELRTALR